MLLKYLMLVHMLFPLTIYLGAQPGLKYAKITSMTTPLDFKYHLHALRDDSLILMVKLKNVHLEKPIGVPVENIDLIRTGQGVSHGKGALNGLIIGMTTGAVLGSLFGLGDPGTSGFFNLSIGEGIALGMFFTVPVSVLLGWAGGARKYKNYEINGNLKIFQDQHHEIQKDLEIDPNITASRFKKKRKTNQ